MISFMLQGVPIIILIFLTVLIFNLNCFSLQLKSSILLDILIAVYRNGFELLKHLIITGCEKASQQDTLLAEIISDINDGITKANSFSTNLSSDITSAVGNTKTLLNNQLIVTNAQKEKVENIRRSCIMF